MSKYFNIRFQKKPKECDFKDSCFRYNWEYQEFSKNYAYLFIRWEFVISGKYKSLVESFKNKNICLLNLGNPNTYIQKIAKEIISNPNLALLNINNNKMAYIAEISKEIAFNKNKIEIL